MSETKTAAKIAIVPNGPYIIENCPVYDDKGMLVAETGKAALCACGKSKSKPFCDGSHKSVVTNV